MASLTQQLFRRKPVTEMSEETGTDTGDSELARAIGLFQLSMFVVGSSDLGPVAQVFLGSRATKILRHSPVPVFVVPRERSEELARA